MFKKIKNSLLIAIVGFVGVSCNSAHELMEPTSMIANQRVRTLVPLESTTPVATTQKNSSTNESNFVSYINKFLNIKYAKMLGVLPQFTSNDLLYSFIDEWYGTRYRLGGNSKKGIDCSAFVQRLYSRVFNVNLLRTAAEQFTSCSSVQKNEDLKEGDLVFFNIHTKRISHVGIYLINNYFVHSSVSSGVMISRLTDTYWKKYFAGAGRVLQNKLTLPKTEELPTSIKLN